MTEIAHNMGSMSKKYRVGVQIPAQRPDDQGRSVFEKGDRFLPPEIAEPLLAFLRANPHIELIENLDYKDASVVGENGKNNVYIGDTCVSDLDAYVWCTVQDPVTPNFGSSVLKLLSTQTKVIPDPQRFAVGLDKVEAHAALKAAGVDVADYTYFDRRGISRAQQMLSQWGAALFKPRWGNFGMGVTLVDDPDRLRDICDYVLSLAGGRSPDAGFLVERFYENDPKGWVSVVVVDGKTEYGYRKLANKYVSLGNGAMKVYDEGKVGGAVEIVPVNAIQRAEAEKAAAALGLPLVSFDMIDHDGRPITIDENTYPGCYPQLLADRGVRMARRLYENIVTTLVSEPTHVGVPHAVAQGNGCGRVLATNHAQVL